MTGPSPERINVHFAVCNPPDQAFVTLATNDSYAKGALVLAQSLRAHHTSRQLVALVGPLVSQEFRQVLRQLYDELQLVDVMDSGDSAHLALMKRPELGVTLTKLHCWTLTRYSKCVFLDADTLVLSNVDELFEKEELSAARDPGWPDCFNSGVFVFKPSNETYEKLLQFSSEYGSFDGGDQGVLNSFFSNWSTADISKHLPFIYNLSSLAIYSYLPAFKQFGGQAKVVHFLGKVKPWNYVYDSEAKSLTSDGSQDPSVTLHPQFLLQWWDIFSTLVAPLLEEQSRELEASHEEVTTEEVIQAVANIQVDSPPLPPPVTPPEVRKQKWEQGDADYLGKDSFDNIQRKLDSFLK